MGYTTLYKLPLTASVSITKYSASITAVPNYTASVEVDPEYKATMEGGG